MRKLLLLSNSTNQGEPYFSWPEKYIKDFLDSKVHKILFVPFAAVTLDYDQYEQMVVERFESMGHEAISIHHFEDPVNAVNEAEAIVVGGGNTFHLLYQLQLNNLLEAIRNKLNQGTPYIGWSAGSNIASPTIQTTNDMPVIQPKDFKALNLVPFQINPHYTDATIPNHGGETREMRIKEFLEINPAITVLGLPEGSLLQILDQRLKFIGKGPLKIFRKGQETVLAESGSVLDELLQSQ